MRVALGGERRKFRQKLITAIRVDPLARCQIPKSTRYFYVEQVWHKK
jgi:hypothetical protein